MKLKKKKVRREYTIDDLVGIAEQIGARIRFELVPLETFGVQRTPEKDELEK